LYLTIPATGEDGRWAVVPDGSVIASVSLPVPKEAVSILLIAI
jgi:hypothetical protein